MDQQLLLVDVPEPAPKKGNLFLAIFPNPHAVQRAVNLGGEWRDKHGLRGKLCPADHLHVTLYDLGACSDKLPRVVQDASRACKAAADLTAPFEIEFDHVMSYGGRPGSYPFVLVNKNGNADLFQFRRLLITELIKQRCLPDGNSKFDPHITLLYDSQIIQQQPIDPVSWVAGEIVMVCSHVGATKYDLLARWKFGG